MHSICIVWHEVVPVAGNGLNVVLHGWRRGQAGSGCVQLAAFSKCILAILIVIKDWQLAILGISARNK